MYTDSSFLVKYRRKVYKEIAALAHQKMDDDSFHWLPDWISAVMSTVDPRADVLSDLDYVAEVCCAALGLEPCRYMDTLSSDAIQHLNTGDTRNAPKVCVLTRLCHKCAQAQEGPRPCEAACQRGAIQRNSLGHAKIDPSKCDSCGACMAACPYQAMTDKSDLYPVIRGLDRGEPMAAILTAGIVEQFSERLDETSLTDGLRTLGFASVLEIGAGEDVDQFRSKLLAVTEPLQAAAPQVTPVLVVADAASKLRLLYHLDAAVQVAYTLTVEELLAMLQSRGLCKKAHRATSKGRN